MEAKPHKPDIANLLAELMHASTSAHMLHLQTRSFAEHSAFDGLYKGLPDLVDRLAETYQGKYGIVARYPNGFTAPEDPKTFLAGLMKCLSRERPALRGDQDLDNILQEIGELVSSTAYKVRFLS